MQPPERWEITPPDPSKRAWGQGIATVGMLMLLVGLPLFIANLDVDFSTGGEGNATAGTAGLVLTGVGAVLTPVGWTMFAQNGLQVDSVPLAELARDETASLQPRLQLSVAF
jgi:hypothetical protein